MRPVAVVEHLDVIDDILFCFFQSLIVHKVNLLRFQAAKEVLHHCIIPWAGYALPAVSFAAHTANDAMLTQDVLIFDAAILTATI